MEYTITNADICELAYALAGRECNIIGVRLEIKDKKTGYLKYTKRGQQAFNEMYDLITNTLNI